MNDVSTIALLSVLLLASARGASIPSAVNAATCSDLCSSCDGVAVYEDGLCECSISASLDNGVECLSRMKRQAQEHGLDLVSCDANEELRSTRCTLGQTRKYGKNDIDQVAKYFMSDGPITGSIFVAPPYTRPVSSPASPIVGASSDCASSQPALLGATLITQPKEFMPVEPVAAVAVAEPRIMPATLGSPLAPLSFQSIAPQFLSLLGEMITRPILALPQTIQSVSQAPGVSELVGAPANFLNSLADQMAQNSKTAKENLDNFREVVGKARDDVNVGLKNLKESTESLAKSNPLVGASAKSKPSYTLTNPHPMISWLNPTVGAPAPATMQFVGSPATVQLLGAAVQAPLMTAVPNQMVGAPAPSSDGCAGQMVGSPSPTYSSNQVVGAAIHTVPVIQSLGTIPLSSIVGQISPSYLVGSPMTYYPAAAQPAASLPEEAHESLEEVPLSSPPQKKICKKSTRDRPSTRFARDVRAAEANEELPEVRLEQNTAAATTTTTTTEVPVVERNTTQKPREKTKEDKSVIGKIKPVSSRTRAEKKTA